VCQELSIANITSILQDQFHHLYGQPLIVLLLFVFLGIASYTDIKQLKIPNKLNLLFLIGRFALIPWLAFGLDHVFGALIAFVSLLIPAMIKMHKMGGDIKCVTVMGLYLGAYLTPVFLILSCIYLALFTVVGMFVGKKAGMMPFAPFFFASHLTLTIVYYVFL